MIDICIAPECEKTAIPDSKWCHGHSHTTMLPDIPPSPYEAPKTNPYDISSAAAALSTAIPAGLIPGKATSMSGILSGRTIETGLPSSGSKLMTPPGELSGGDVNYYLLEITEPKRMKPSIVECEDIIEALQMTFAEGNVLKALWRSCAMRVRGHGKRGADDHGVYDGDKIAYYGDRIRVQRVRQAKLIGAERDRAAKNKAANALPNTGFMKTKDDPLGLGPTAAN
jgi:hypothetical protein